MVTLSLSSSTRKVRATGHATTLGFYAPVPLRRCISFGMAMLICSLVDMGTKDR